MPPLAVCQCLPIYVEHLCLLDVTSIFSSEQQKARDQTPSVDTANFANEFDDGAATPPVDPLIERASRKKGRPSFYFIKYFLLSPRILRIDRFASTSNEPPTTRLKTETKDCERDVVNRRTFFFFPLSSKYGIVIYYLQ